MEALLSRHRPGGRAAAAARPAGTPGRGGRALPLGDREPARRRVRAPDRCRRGADEREEVERVRGRRGAARSLGDGGDARRPCRPRRRDAPRGDSFSPARSSGPSKPWPTARSPSSGAISGTGSASSAGTSSAFWPSASTPWRRARAPAGHAGRGARRAGAPGGRAHLRARRGQSAADRGRPAAGPLPRRHQPRAAHALDRVARRGRGRAAGRREAGRRLPRGALDGGRPRRRHGPAHRGPALPRAIGGGRDPVRHAARRSGGSRRGGGAGRRRARPRAPGRRSSSRPRRRPIPS